MVSVDTVYQRVLALANKEQRGYITPQEFNLLANQAQMVLFDQYFYDKKQALETPGNESEYSDIIKTLNEKISIFKTDLSLTVSGDYFSYPTDMYKLGTVIIGTSSSTAPILNGVEAQEINYDELLDYINSPLTKPTIKNPIYLRRQDGLQLIPETITACRVTYVRYPKKVNWGYVITLGEAMYNPSAPDAQNFELHNSEESVLVYKILELAGVTLNKPALAQTASNEEIEIKTNQKI